MNEMRKLHESINTTEKDIVLSSEALQEVSPQILSKWFGKHDVKIIVYLREQAEYLISTYQQEIKARTEMRPFAEWLESCAGRGCYFLDVWLDEWARVFGQQNVIVRIYDRKIMVGSDIVSDFASILGLDPEPLQTILLADANPSVKGSLLEAKRRINRLGFQERDLHEKTYTALRELALEIDAYRGPMGCDPMLVTNIRAQCSDCNRRIAARYFGGQELFCLKGIPNELMPDEDAVQFALDLLVARLRRDFPAFAEELDIKLNMTDRATCLDQIDWGVGSKTPTQG
jgi:hypothetical protein